MEGAISGEAFALGVLLSGAVVGGMILMGLVIGGVRLIRGHVE